MTTSTPAKPLRLWPGVAAGVLLALLWFVIPDLLPDEMALNALFGGLGCVLLVVLWWLFFSRAPWLDRIGFLLLAAVTLVATGRLVHESIAGGMMGMMLTLYAVPVLSLALVAGAVIGSRLSNRGRRATMAAAIVFTCAAFTVIRTGGTMGFHSDLHWRWTPTPEERLLASTASETDPAPTAPVPAPPPVTAAPVPTPPAATTTPAAPVAAPPSDPDPAPAWPGFRGPARDSVVRAVRIDTDWATSPPVELWRRPIGPGWSSFAVHGTHILTQEQRGEDEIVAAYDIATGLPVWRHRDPARFWESNAGPGPRGTPTYSHGRIYTLGATGILNALDARTGRVIWSRNAASDTKADTPIWGFAASPLVIDDIVVVATSGVLAAYDLATGQPRWVGPTGGSGYSSPHFATIGGVPQVLLLNNRGAKSVAPRDGSLLWSHEWRSDGIVQPYVIADRDVLIGSGSGGLEVGMRRVAVTRDAGDWKVEERWTSKGLKPYFNDFIVHKGHAFGFDGTLLSCIDLADGTRKWKGGRYGQGQMILLPDQDVLLVLSEEGELALVSATPDEFKELARFKAIEGKTWNHPVLVGDTLLVRNGEEMAAFRVKLVRK